MTVNLALAERGVTATRGVFGGELMMRFFLVTECVVIPESVCMKELGSEMFCVLKKCVAARTVVAIYERVAGWVKTWAHGPGPAFWTRIVLACAHAKTLHALFLRCKPKHTALTTNKK